MKIGIFDPYLDDLGGGEKYMMTLAEVLSRDNEVSIFWENQKDIEKLVDRFSLDISRLKLAPNIFSPKLSFRQRFNLSKNYDAIVILIGPKTDIEGIFHGPLYYYTMTLPFLLFSGNPLSMAYFFIFLNALTAIFIYFAGKEMFSARAGILASLFFAVSYGTIVYSHWLSGHPLTIPMSPLFVLFLFRYL